MNTLNEIMIEVNGWVYNMISDLYSAFLVLSRINLFKNNSSLLLGIVHRIYYVVGIAMLFILAYSLLRQIVNPEQKDKKSGFKLALGIVKTLVVIAIVPTVFSMAFDVQDAIFKKNTIGKIIIGVKNSSTDEIDPDSEDYTPAIRKPEDIIDSGGNTIAVSVFETFFYPYRKTCESYSKDASKTEEDYINCLNEFSVAGGKTYKSYIEDVQKNGNFSAFKDFKDKINKEDQDEYIIFNPIFALLCGGFCVYMLLSFCISLAIRLFKLAAYEIMAPVAAILDISPGSNGTFSKWLKVTATTFAEAMIRVAALFFVVYIINIINGSWDTIVDSSVSLKAIPFLGLGNGALFIQLLAVAYRFKKFVRTFIILGVILFAKQAPQLISEVTGIDSKNMSMGLKDQLQQSGAWGAGKFALGALAGGAVNSVRSGVAATKYAKNARKRLAADYAKSGLSNDQIKKKMRGHTLGFIARGVGSTIGGGIIGGGLRSGWSSRNATGIDGMRSSISTANQRTEAKREGKYGALTENPHFRSWKDASGKIHEGRAATMFKARTQGIQDYFGAGSGRYQTNIDNANELLSYEKEARSEAASVISKFGLVTKMGLEVDGSDIKLNGKIIGGRGTDGKFHIDEALLAKNGIDKSKIGDFKGNDAIQQAEIMLNYTNGFAKSLKIADYENILAGMTKTDFSDAANQYKLKIEKDIRNSSEYSKIELDATLSDAEKASRKELLIKEAIEAKQGDINSIIQKAEQDYLTSKTTMQSMIANTKKATENYVLDNIDDFKNIIDTFHIDPGTVGDFSKVKLNMDQLKSKMSAMGDSIDYVTQTFNTKTNEIENKEVIATSSSSIKDIKDAAEFMINVNTEEAKKAKAAADMRAKMKGDKK